MKTYTIVLTEDEKERLSTIISYNIDLNLTPERDQYIKNNRLDAAMKVAEQIRFDKQLMMKLL